MPGTGPLRRARLTGVRGAEVRYVERDGDYLAYTVFGEGPHDLAVSPGRIPIDLMWQFPQLAAFMEALARMARVIAWDARGFGGSDPSPVPSVSNAETYVDDLRALLDAADSERATLFQMKSGSHI